MRKPPSSRSSPIANSPSASPRRASCSPAPIPSTSAASCPRSCTTSPHTRSSFAPAISHAATRSSSACRPATSATSSPAITPSASVFPWHGSSWRATRTTCCSTFSPRARTTASAPSSPQPRRPWISSFPRTSSVCSTTCPTATPSSSPGSWASWQMRAPTPFPTSCSPRSRRCSPAAGPMRRRLPAPSRPVGMKTVI